VIEWEPIKDFYRRGKTHIGYVWLRYSKQMEPEALYTKFNGETIKYVLTEGPDFKQNLNEEDSMTFTELLIETNKKK
jgi:hypothetical protein